MGGIALGGIGLAYGDAHPYTEASVIQDTTEIGGLSLFAVGGSIMIVDGFLGAREERRMQELKEQQDANAAKHGWF